MALKSMDFSRIAFMKGDLTDRKIDEYSLKGYYDHAQKQRMLDRVRHGECKAFDERIRKGEFGVDAIVALKSRRRRTKTGVSRIPRVKDTSGLSPLQIEALKQMALA